MFVMRPFFSKMRLIIVSVVLLLLVAFGAFSFQLSQQVNKLRVSSSDNIQWSLSQLEVQLGHYMFAVLTNTDAPDPDIDAVRLSFELLISRLHLVREGRVAEELALVPRARELLTEIDDLLLATEAMFANDDAIVAKNLMTLGAWAADFRPAFRSLALIGVERFASLADRNRAAVARQLTRTGGFALLLLAFLFAILLFVDRLYRRAEKADEAKSQFLAVMSHEMRTPVNGILGVLDLLKSSKLNTEQMRYVQIAASSSENLLEHVNQVLDITQIEAGETMLADVAVDFGALCRSVHGELEPLAGEKQLKLGLTFAPDVEGTYLSDPQRLRQILTNLIGNAIKFTQNGNILVSVSHLSGGTLEPLVEIKVRDTGAGIAADDIHRIFDDFVTLDASLSRRTTGTGLGLAITRRIVNAMNGTLEVQSTFGVGSTFLVRLPLVRTSDKSAATNDYARESDRPEIAARRVLIVEDNGVNRIVLREMLEKLGQKVFEAPDGRAGVEMATRQAFDMIFMDISMPGIDGIEATRQIRASSGVSAQTTIIGLTAHNISSVRRSAIEAGMERLFVKPLRLHTLSEILADNDQPDRTEPISENANAQEWEADAPSTLLDDEILNELFAVLGRRRMEQSMLRFFAQCDAGLDTMARSATEKDLKNLSDISHKLSGASALLGCVRLHTHLSQLSRAAEDADMDTLGQAHARVPQCFADTQNALADWKPHKLTSPHR